MISLRQYDTIILDCDGVILDSNDLKIEAFRQVVGAYDHETVAEFIDYVRKNFGKSRYHFFTVFIEKFLSMDFDQGLYEELLEKFAIRCRKLYLYCDFTDGFCSFLEAYSEKQLFVASGSDEAELKYIFEHRGIAGNFRDIFGSPKAKGVIIQKLSQVYPDSVVVGDAYSDKEAAAAAQLDFLYMSRYSINPELSQDESISKCYDLRDLI